MTMPYLAGSSRRLSRSFGQRLPERWWRRTQARYLIVVVFVVALASARFYSRRNTLPLVFPNGKRIFGPAFDGSKSSSKNEMMLTFNTKEQRSFLDTNGWTCQASFADRYSANKNLLLERFDALPPSYGVELWKYCVLYLNPGMYWDTSMALPLQLVDDIISENNLAISLDLTEEASNEHQHLHHSLLKIQEPHSKVALGMMRLLLESDSLSPTSLHETLALLVTNDMNKKRGTWKFFKAACQDAVPSVENFSAKPDLVIQIPNKQRADASSFDLGEPCSAKNGEPCCQVWSPDSSNGVPALALVHSHFMALNEKNQPVAADDKNPLPFLFQHLQDVSSLEDTDLGMPVADLPYIAVVRETKTNAPPATTHETPNFFDILLRNSCLPPDKECYACLKLGYDGAEGGDCTICADKCECYCKTLCSVRPPPKRLSAVWDVTVPRYRKDPSRWIPRVIHQTWFEPVTEEAYPNMSRLIESFRQSGWEYEFYDDDKAAQFLSAHFPPEVREAYDAIIPGAFRADLFRYCVLLIRGGVYADMDIMLESNLDHVVDGTIGFMTPQDTPGEPIGHRSCLWNGFMASAPGHVFLAQTIQNVVNNVRNRFTSVDYDDMLCPNPVLSLSHTVDTLYTCGPCILGASLNDVLQRHRQTGFDFGDIDIFETERNKYIEIHGNTTESIRATITPSDPRLLIQGRSVILRQNKEDMGSHRFTHASANVIVAATDMPEYDDRPETLVHYSKSHVKFGVYGITKLYTNNDRANEEVRIRVKSARGDVVAVPINTK
jgi:Glycosyltransferase sugar-binding region containing DXD motif